MSGNRKFVSNTSSGLALLMLLAAWVLPAHAVRQHEGRQSVSVRAGEQHLIARNGDYADYPASNTRRYPPRHNEGNGNREYADKRNNRRRYVEDREAVTEKRRYYNGKRAPYSTGPQGNRSYAQDRGPVNGQRQYPRGRKAPNSSEYRGNTKPVDGYSRRQQDTSLDDAISRVRRQSEGRVLSAETVRQNDREEHRVRVITDDGRVRRYRMDAQTGDILPRRP